MVVPDNSSYAQILYFMKQIILDDSWYISQIILPTLILFVIESKYIFLYFFYLFISFMDQRERFCAELGHQHF